MDLEENIKRWERVLLKCQYAGEVVITEEDLPNIAIEIHKRFFSSYLFNSIKTAVFVLAINCMYYRHDERGFWFHFCQLLEVPDDYKTQSIFGDIIESQLIHFGFLDEPGYGPFRYVSPLREQTGITRQEIPRFANLVSNMSMKHGWSGIRALSRNSFNSFITTHLQSGHLYKFLISEAGWNFTIDVARSITQYQQKKISLAVLKTIEGYRSGFFEELFKELRRPPEPVEEVASKPPRPKLTFMPEFRKVMLLFDQEGVNNSAYELFGQRILQTPIECSEEMFKEELPVRLRDSEGKWHPWAMPGWDPKRKAVALFHVDNGYIANPRQLVSGNYFCLASPDNAPPSELHQGYYGLVDLPFEDMDYDAWVLVLDPTKDLSWAGFAADNVFKNTGYISWETDQNRLESAVDIEKVFVGSLPPVHIRNIPSFVSNIVSLFIEHDTETSRLSVSPNDKYIDIKSSIPSCGKIWVEPISRRKEFEGLDILDELLFVLMPSLEVVWPCGLLVPDSTPKVTLVTQHPDMFMTLSDSVRLDDKGLEWNIYPGIDVIQGRIECGGISVNIARRIYRASVRKANEGITPYFIRDDFNSNLDIIVSGVSGMDVSMSIFDGKEYIKILALGTFNKAGDYRCSSMALRDPMSHFKSPAGVFTIYHEGNEVETSTFFMDIRLILELISSESIMVKPIWFDILPADIVSFLNSLIAVRDKAQPQMVVNHNLFCPKPLLSYARLIAICSATYDGTILTHRATDDEDFIVEIQDDNPSAAEAMRWFIQASSFCAENGKTSETAQELIKAYNKLKWKPPFSRWISAINDLLAVIRAEADIIILLEEWKDEVRRGYRPKFQSRLARKHFGKDLTEAWITYAAGNCMGAVTKAKNLIRVATSPVVDIAEILLRLCWMRLAYFASQPKINYKSSNPRLSLANKTLKSIVCFTENLSKLKKGELDSLRIIMQAIPLTDEDYAVFKILLCGNSNVQIHDENDWLICYYHLCIAEDKHDNVETLAIARRLDGLRDDIPSSPDKLSVIQLLEKYI